MNNDTSLKILGLLKYRKMPYEIVCVLFYPNRFSTADMLTGNLILIDMFAQKTTTA